MIKPATVLISLLLAAPTLAQTTEPRAGAGAGASVAMTPAQHAWFGEAVGHILSGQVSARMSDNPSSSRTR